MKKNFKDYEKMEAEDMIHTYENIKGIDADFFTKSQKVSTKKNVSKTRLWAPQRRHRVLFVYPAPSMMPGI